MNPVGRIVTWICRFDRFTSGQILGETCVSAGGPSAHWQASVPMRYPIQPMVEPPATFHLMLASQSTASPASRGPLQQPSRSFLFPDKHEVSTNFKLPHPVCAASKRDYIDPAGHLRQLSPRVACQSLAHPGAKPVLHLSSCTKNQSPPPFLSADAR